MDLIVSAIPTRSNDLKDTNVRSGDDPVTLIEFAARTRSTGKFVIAGFPELRVGPKAKRSDLERQGLLWAPDEIRR
jgi:hypothetical protein